MTETVQAPIPDPVPTHDQAELAMRVLNCPMIDHGDALHVQAKRSLIAYLAADLRFPASWSTHVPGAIQWSSTTISGTNP